MVSSPFQKTTRIDERIAMVPSLPAHIPAIAQIMVDAEPWSTYGFEQDFIEHFLSGCVQAKIIRTVMAREAESENETVVGALSLHPGFLGGRYIEILVLAESMRGQGLGRRIIDVTCEEMPSAMRDLYLLVAESNTKAVAFYRHLGFREVGPLPDLIAPGMTEILMWRRFR